MTSQRQRRAGYPLPLVVETDTFVCLTLQVPNKPEYISAITGAITSLGQWFSWEKSYDIETDAARRAAQLWRQTIYDTLVIADGCGGNVPIDCAEVEACVTTRPGISTFINSQVDESLYQYQPTYYQGRDNYSKLAVPVSQTCNLDELFFKIRGTFDILNNNNADFFQQAEVNTNLGVEFGSIFASLASQDISGLNSIFEFIGYVQDSIAENYDAALTDEYRDEVTCAIFCEFRNECGGITLQWLFDFFAGRVGASFDTSTLFTAVEEVSDYIVNIVDGLYDNVNTVDVFMAAQLLFLRVLNGWSNPDALRATERLITQIRTLDGTDNDWQLLCTDCAGVTGWIVYGQVGFTAVSRVGDTYTISGGVNTQNTPAWRLYIQTSIDGVPQGSGALTYTAVSFSGYATFDWGDSDNTYTTAPPSTSAVGIIYAGGAGATGDTGLTIVITTALPFQGVVQGS